MGMGWMRGLHIHSPAATLVGHQASLRRNDPRQFGPAVCPVLRPAQATGKKKPRYQRDSGVFIFLGWLMGLEPTTTGITILDSTN
jgi:hypothetical protein